MLRVESFSWGHQGISSQSYTDWHANQANSAGGVSVRGMVKNHGQKAVKKYTVYFKAYNGANEMVKCETTGKSIVGVSSADRVEPLYIQEFLLDNAWYNHSIRRVEIDHIDVVYTDDTTESCRGNYILNLEEQKAQQECNKNTKKLLKGCLIYHIVFILVIILLSASK